MFTKYNSTAKREYDPVQAGNVIERDAALIDRWQKGDDAAGRELIDLYAFYIHKRVARMARINPNMDKNDLHSEAVIGFLEAARRYEPEKGFQLSTYAEFWVKAKGNAYILDNYASIKMPSSAGTKAIFFKIRDIKKRLERQEGAESREDTLAYIAKGFGVSIETLETMLSALTRANVELDAKISSDDAGSSSFLDMMAGSAPSPEDILVEQDEVNLRRDWLKASVGELSPREQHIFEKRRMGDEDDQLTLADLADELGISRERVRQIEERAFGKVQQSMLRRAKAYKSPKSPEFA